MTGVSCCNKRWSKPYSDGPVQGICPPGVAYPGVRITERLGYALPDFASAKGVWKDARRRLAGCQE